MDREKMREIADFILNRATTEELAVVREALVRREKSDSASILRFNPGRMADEMAKSVNRNVEASMEGVRTMVRDFVAEIIRKEAPEVSEAQLKEICDIYVPKPGKHNRNSKKGNITSSQFPPEALIQMVEQFVSYSTGSMSAGEQVHLNEIMPGWQEKYFRAFPAEVQKLLRSYLKGETDAETCFEGIYNELGL